MSTAVIDQPSPTRLRTSPVVKPARRRAPARGPLARPVRTEPIPRRRGASVHFAGGSSGIVLPYSSGEMRACRITAVSRPSSSWRLTDRGIALVLALTAVLVVAAVTVIGLTAWRVTSPGYHETGVSQLSRR
ncbi:MAG TPA: hypothetical protein VNT27_02710 [Propionibacteriaceae bacterium]|nr:hypothetical protein [Propionibacteriaceae bacterium]